jgi:hypothetical protein
MTSTVSKATTTVAPGIFDADYIVPVLVLAFVVINVGSDPKYTCLRNYLGGVVQNPLKVLPEIFGFLCVVAVAATGLLLAPGGILASKQSMTQDKYMSQTRDLWPTLCHPDSLLVCQELLLGLGGALLLVRGACNSSSRVLAVSLALLTIGRGIHLEQWGRTGDYAPEGPLGGAFAAACAAVAGLLLLMATLKSLASANAASFTGVVRDLVTVCGLLSLSVCVAKSNYITASDVNVRNVLFSLVDVVDLCAFPLLASSACGLALNTGSMGGALASFALAQAFASWWLLDFTGVLDDPLSQNAFIMHNLKIKQQLMSQVYGHPFLLFAIGQIVRATSALVAYGGYMVLRLAASDMPSTRLLAV